jgi:hypothetical protein
VLRVNAWSLLGLPLSRQGTTVFLFFAILDGVLYPLDESDVALFAVWPWDGFQFGQEGFESLDLFVVGHDVRLEEQVVVFGDVVGFGVDDAFNLFEEFFRKLSEQVALRDLLEANAQVLVVFQWQSVDREEEFPDLALGLRRRVGCLAELLGLAEQVRLVSLFELGHGLFFILQGEALAAVDALDNSVLLPSGDLEAFNRSARGIL